MHCVLLSSPLGSGYWRLRRSVEVIGYHGEDDTARILVILAVTNTAPPSTKNYLRIMHRGNVEAFLRDAWPLPDHYDEAARWKQIGAADGGKAGSRGNVLIKLYREAFKEVGDELLQIEALTGWDEFLPIDPPVRVFACGLRSCLDGVKESPRGHLIEPEVPSPSADTYSPFTSWKLGPFIEPGLHLLALELTFTGETYKELVTRGEFTIDGPQRLLARVKHDDLARLSDRERTEWQSRLDKFEGHSLLLGQSYDVIILRDPFADPIQMLGGTGIARAPKQPMCKNTPVADRFVTTNQAFSIALRPWTKEVSEAEPALALKL